MINSKKINGLILALLIISTPAHPTGWFDTTLKKVGVCIAAIAAGIVINRMLDYALLRYFYRNEDTIIELDRPPELPASPQQEFYFVPTSNQSTVKAMLDQGINPNVKLSKPTYYFIKGCNTGICILPVATDDGANNIRQRFRFAGRNRWKRDIFFRYDEPKYHQHFIDAGVIDLVEKHTYKKNQAAIAEKTHQFSFQTECHSEKDVHTANFNSGISDIIGAYAAENNRDVHDIEGESA
jgi:hypothetical protein